MNYTPAMLARLAHAHAAQQLSESLISQTSTGSDSYGAGAFVTEDAARSLSDARELLTAAVVADRLRGASWTEVGESLGISRQSAHERFGAAEREFRQGLLFPHRYPEDGGLGYTVAPYAVEQPDGVREQLDAWVAEHRRHSSPDRDEPQPVTRGLTAMADTSISDRIGQVLELSNALIHRNLPAGVSYDQAHRRQLELKVELYEAMVAQRSDDPEPALQLMEAREQLAKLAG